MATTIPDNFRYLLDAPGTAILSTHNPDGSIQTTAVWFHYDGDKIRLSLNDARRKLANLRRDPKVNLFFLDLGNPQRSLEVRATAEAAPDDGGSFAATVGEKYGADLASYDPPGSGRWVVTLRPDRVNATDMGA